MNPVENKKIEYWKSRLLDTGKRNKMINYRETARATLKIVEPGLDELYANYVQNENELTFEYPLDKDSDIRTYSVLRLFDRLSCPIPVILGDIKVATSFQESKKKELTPTIVNSLIQRIEVHNNDKYDGHCHVKVDIYFTAVGMIDIPDEKEILDIINKIQENPQMYKVG